MPQGTYCQQHKMLFIEDNILKKIWQLVDAIIVHSDEVGLELKWEKKKKEIVVIFKKKETP